MIFHSVILCIVLTSVCCVPYDDGRYRPKKYEFLDDGRYYRPIDEGKYIPGDEGRYTYVYHQGLYPTDDGDYRYRHQVGPNGGVGGNGGFGGGGGFGGEGGFGPNGPDTPNTIEYIGKKTYAERYPYIHKVIEELVNRYVSPDILNFGDTSDASENHVNKYNKNEVAAKCKLLYTNTTENSNETEFVTQYPPRLQLKKGQNLVSYYTFKGRKDFNIDTLRDKNMKLDYEVYVKIVTED